MIDVKSKSAGEWLHMKLCNFIFLSVTFIIASGCNIKHANKNVEQLEQSLIRMIDSIPGTVGIAIIGNQDTITINNNVRFPMMSVFKLHQALAVAATLEKMNGNLDSTLYIASSELDKNTWSPMLKEKGENDMWITIRELLDYSLTMSDNNASNILFSRIISPQKVDNYIRTISEDTTFRILYSEAEMMANHELSYQNYSSPLSATLLLRQVFTTNLYSSPYQDAIKNALINVTTGQDRLGAITPGNDKIQFAHKTGTGFRDKDDRLMAFNDIGYFKSPDGLDYSLGVMIRDFSGSEEEAALWMARISNLVYNYFE